MADTSEELARKAFTEGFLAGNAGRGWDMMPVWWASKTKLAIDQRTGQVPDAPTLDLEAAGYQCRCCVCGKVFPSAEKRAVCCTSCATKPAEGPTTEDRLRVRCEALEALLVAKEAKREHFDFKAFIERQRAFSERAFGPGLRTEMITDHIRKELLEVQAEPKDLVEWIDVILMGLDGAWRCGRETLVDPNATPAAIIMHLNEKLTKNEGRTWPDWRTMDTTKAPHHIEPAPAALKATGRWVWRNEDGTYIDNMAQPGPAFTKAELEVMAEGLGEVSGRMHERRHDAHRDGRHTDAKEHSREAAVVESLALRLKEMAEKAT